MVKRPKRYYWDSCVHVDLLQQNKDNAVRLLNWHNLAMEGRIEFHLSTLVIAEVAFLKDSDGTRQEQGERIKAHFKHPCFVFYEVDRATAELAADLLREHEGLRGADAVHLATAIRSGVLELHSYDPALLKLNGLCDGLIIIDPPAIAVNEKMPFNDDENVPKIDLPGATAPLS